MLLLLFFYFCFYQSITCSSMNSLMHSSLSRKLDTSMNILTAYLYFAIHIICYHKTNISIRIWKNTFLKVLFFIRQQNKMKQIHKYYFFFFVSYVTAIKKMYFDWGPNLFNEFFNTISLIKIDWRMQINVILCLHFT